MSTDRIHSFSVKPGDIEGNKLVNELKKHSIRSGIKFNHMVLEGLKLYVIENKLELTDGKKV